MKPVVVDLDGTLLNSDVLIESTLQLIRKNVLYLFCLPFWLLKGKAHLKARIATLADLDVTTLPYNTDLLEYLHTRKAAGCDIWLATATNEKYANAIAGHLGVFSRVLASDNQQNLTGRKKRLLLVDELGEKGFDYAANAPVDLAVWEVADNAIVVNATESLTAKVSAVTRVEAVFRSETRILRGIINSLRPHQWVKNTLIFVPMVMAHQYSEISLWFSALVAFLAFSLCASGVYVINDLLDLSEDRQHRSKSRRALASGLLPLRAGLVLVPLTLVAALLLALLLPLEYLLTLAIYFLFTCAYSFSLKRFMLLDVITLASLYTLRIIGGSMALDIELTFWLLAFSMFVFLSLALIKRYSELLELKSDTGGLTVESRGYQVSDLELLASLGVSSGYLSVLVLALYINSEEVTEVYTHPQFLWLCCPLFLFWISRTWLLSHRGLMHDDPIVWAIRDRVSYLVGALMLLTATFAI